MAKPPADPEATPSRRRKSARLLGILALIAKPPRWFAVLLLGWILAEAIHTRTMLNDLVPTAIWSSDAMSYVGPAAKLAYKGLLRIESKRGPVYSLLIAAFLKGGGGFHGVILAQHALGVLGIAACCAIAWIWFRRAAWPAVLLGGMSLATYNQTAFYEHMVRNETVLAAAATGVLALWIVGVLRPARWPWALCGASTGLAHLVKGVFSFFPLVAIATAAAALPRRRSVPAIAWFTAGLALVLAAGAILRAAENPPEPRAPQFGILLFGRTAQWTVLDQGIEPALKSAIRQDILDYRMLPETDNNLILNDTAVPKLRKLLPSPAEVERVCGRLAFEAILAHPREFLAQIARDWSTLHTRTGFACKVPKRGELVNAAEAVESKNHQLGPRLDAAGMGRRLREAADSDFRPFYKRTLNSPLFEWGLPFGKNRSPVLTTSLLLPVLIFLSRRRNRILYAGLGAVWFVSLLVLCTVGRPMDRYLLPLTPVMFWVMTGALATAWRLLVCAALRVCRRNPAAEPASA